MKFGEEFTEKMLPEWQEAYMDFNKLKSVLEQIQQSRQTPYTTFSGLTQTHTHSPGSSQRRTESQPPISVNLVIRDGSETYETTFHMVSGKGGEYELVYFRRLDDEFNKVEQFYRSRLEELRKEADELKKQVDAFIAFRIKVENPTLDFDRSTEMTPALASHVPSNTAALPTLTPRGTTLYRSVSTIMKAMDEESSQHEEHSNDSNDSKLEASVSKTVDEEITEHEEQSDDSSDSELEEEKTSNTKVEEQKPKNRSAPLEVLSRVRMNNNLETPCSTIKGLLNCKDQTELSYTRKNVEKVEQKLKRAFIQFHENLQLLNRYSLLSTLAFSKIMKKYDKITSRGAAEVYTSEVKKSHFGSNDEVIKLIEWVKTTFIEHFANSNHRKGMSMLRPHAKTERHPITFTVGFLAGCTISLLLVLTLIVLSRKIHQQQGTTQYMETLFRLDSLFGFMVLHILMLAADLYFCGISRVNYSFIFGFKKGQVLGYRDVLLLGFGIAPLAIFCVLANLDMQVDPNTQDYNALTELLPLILLLILIVVLSWPFNVYSPPNRVFFLRCLFRCICAPFYKVAFADSFLADQFTSQVQALRSLVFYICYYGWGDFKHRQCNCEGNTIFIISSFLVAAIPYWIRFLQCLRRRFEEKDPMQGYNALKQLITIAAVCLRTAYAFYGGKGLQVLAWISSVAATIFSTYWDLVLGPFAKAFQESLFLNVLLRFAWLQTILNLKFSFFHKEAMITLFTSLEIIRRGIWNFFRLENEHLKNVAHYHAFKSETLPFNYDEDKSKDIEEGGSFEFSRFVQ